MTKLKRPHRRHFLHLAACVAALPAVSPMPAVAQQTWPQRTVKLIVPLGPGSASDMDARLMAERLAKRWGQPVSVENRPGGDAIPAIMRFIGANDDHTLLFAPSSVFIAHPFEYAKLSYDPAALIPVVKLSETLVILSVPAVLNVSNLAGLVALAHKEPGKINWHALTSLNDMQTQAFAKRHTLDIVRVPYRDGTQALNDLTENRIQLYSSSFAVVRPAVEAGKARPIAVTATQRAGALPDVATVREQGYPELEFEGMVGVFALSVVPPAARQRIENDVIELGRDKEVIERLTATAQVVKPAGAAAFASALDVQRAAAVETVRITGYQPNR
jgi:tripartite-type tricarboxylate transporter receptor subunit TctC